MTARVPDLNQTPYYTDMTDWMNANHFSDGTIKFKGPIFYDIRSYGATTVGNATSGVQAAIDAAYAAGGGIVVIPGNFVLGSQIRLKSNIILQGIGWSSALTCNNNFPDTSMITLDSTSVTQTVIRDLFINGNKGNQSQAVAAVKYPRVIGHPQHIVENCYFFSWSGRGLDIDCQAAHIRDCYFWANDAEGIYISYHDTKLFNCDVGSSGFEGIVLDGASNVQMAECGMWGSGRIDPTKGSGVKLTNNSQVLKAVNNESSDNAQHGWNLDSTYFNSIIGGTAAENLGAVFRLNGGEENYIQMFLTGGGRGTSTSLLQFDTAAGTSFYNHIEIDYNEAAIGGTSPIASNPEIVGTVHPSNFIKINQHTISTRFRDFKNITYSASMTPDTHTGEYQKITVTNGTAMTINAPTNGTLGRTLTFDIKNSSGGTMGTITWNAVYLLAGTFTNPANGKRRTITFYYSDDGNWVETHRAATDI